MLVTGGVVAGWPAKGVCEPRARLDPVSCGNRRLSAPVGGFPRTLKDRGGGIVRIKPELPRPAQWLMPPATPAVGVRDGGPRALKERTTVSVCGLKVADEVRSVDVCYRDQSKVLWLAQLAQLRLLDRPGDCFGTGGDFKAGDWTPR